MSLIPVVKQLTTMPYNDKELAEKELAHHQKECDERYPKLEGECRLVEITDKEGVNFHKEVIKWHNNLD